jgi:hypothetical protein
MSRVLESSRGLERLLADLGNSLTNASTATLGECVSHGLGRLASRATTQGASLKWAAEGIKLIITD